MGKITDISSKLLILCAFVVINAMIIFGHPFDLSTSTMRSTFNNSGASTSPRSTSYHNRDHQEMSHFSREHRDGSFHDKPQMGQAGLGHMSNSWEDRRMNKNTSEMENPIYWSKRVDLDENKSGRVNISESRSK